MADKEKKYSDIDLSQYASGFQGSAALTQAGTNKQNAANAYKAYADKGFSSEYQGMADSILNQYLNRDPFSYDFNADALYQQYKDKYIQQGKMAMQDTMGQAAAMTGGYGNSYAATVGNQAYQAHLQNLNDIIPELYQLAYDKYNQEGKNMLNKYSMLGDAVDREYGMWYDGLNILAADRDYYGQEESNLYNREYNAWNDNRNYDTTQYWNETNFGYGKEQDDITNAYRDREMAIAESEEKRKQEAWDLEKADLYGSGGNGGNGGSGGSGGSGGGNGDTGNGGGEDSFESELNTYIKNGATRSEISTYLRSAWKAGKITEEQYKKYKETYVPQSSSGGIGGHYTY